MAIGLFSPKILLRCTSVCILLFYFHLMANSRLVSSNTLESWHYFVTYTKARMSRNDLLTAYDLIVRLTVFLPVALIIPYFCAWGGAVVFMSRGFNWTRLIRPYFHNHRNWSYQPHVERDQFKHYNEIWGHIDDWYMMISMAAVIIACLHYMFDKSVVGQLFSSTSTKPRIEVAAK